MAFHYSPKIVTDGLVLCLDAGNTKSYIGSGTWSDISRGGNNGTLVNGPTFSSLNGGSILFDGIDDRVSKTGSINTGQNFTVNAWIYPTLLGTTRRALVGNGYSYFGPQGWLFSTSGGSINNTFFISVGADQAYKVASADTLSLNKWQYVSGVVVNGGTTITLYLNGNTTNTSLVSLTSVPITYSNTEEFNIGFRNTVLDPDPFTGQIAMVSIYNRTLTSQEILQNFNVTKTRFGL